MGDQGGREHLARLFACSGHCFRSPRRRFLGQLQQHARASIFPAAPLGLRFSLGTGHTAQRFSPRPFQKAAVVIAGAQ